MKKLKIFFIVLIGMFPLICNASVEKEVNYKWYTLVEDNVHYESEIEGICEYFDKDDFKYGDWITSLTKPELKDYRVIKEEVDYINIRRDYFNVLKISGFETNGLNLNIIEMGFFDKNDKYLDNTLTNYIVGGIDNIIDNDLNTFISVNPFTEFVYSFENLVSVRDLKLVIKYKDDVNLNGIDFSVFLNNDIHLNAFSVSETLDETVCRDGFCVKEVVIRDDFYNEDIVLREKVYKYQDKLYKCYDLKKLYVPGYHSNLEGYIKDENDYVEIVREIKVETEILNDKKQEDEIKDTVEEDNSFDNEDDALLDEDVEDIVDDIILSKPIAMVTKEDDVNRESVFPYVLLLIALFMISVLFFVARKVVKSRTN